MKLVYFILSLLTVFCLIGLVYLIIPWNLYSTLNNGGSNSLLYSLVPAVVGILVATIFVYYSSKRQYETMERFRNELKNEEKQLVQGLKQSDTDFAALWSLTQGRIDYYHQIATNQSRRSFISSQIATAAGFILVVVVAVLAAQATSPTAAISAGAVGVVGGGLSAYIGATFLKSQAEATAQLRQFFLQPVEFSRLLGAERLIDSLEKDQRSEAVQNIVKSMMASQSSAENKKEP
jgi:hypothetical protein